MGSFLNQTPGLAFAISGPGMIMVDSSLCQSKSDVGGKDRLTGLPLNAARIWQQSSGSALLQLVVRCKQGKFGRGVYVVSRTILSAPV